MWVYIPLVAQYPENMRYTPDDLNDLHLERKLIHGPYGTRAEVDEAIARKRDPNSLYTHILVLQGEVVEMTTPPKWIAESTDGGGAHHG